MDLGTIQGQFADFGTFAKNIGTAFQYFPDLIKDILVFADTSDQLSSNTDRALDEPRRGGRH